MKTMDKLTEMNRNESPTLPHPAKSLLLLLLLLLSSFNRVRLCATP